MAKIKMRILVISNYYPPFELGGWEQLTRDVVNQLKSRGHQLCVLTSNYKAGHVLEPESNIARILHLESPDHTHYHPYYVFQYPWHAKQNRHYLIQTVKQFEPDIIFINGMWNLSPAIAWQAEQLCPGRVVYYMASYWPTGVDAHTAYWDMPPKSLWLHRPKQLIGKLAKRTFLSRTRGGQLSFPRVLCVSAFMQNYLVEQVEIPRSQTFVVHNGIELEHFIVPPKKNGSSTLRLLYAGRLASDKGVHTAIESLGYLLKNYPSLPVSLSIVGGGAPSYEARLKKQAQELNLTNIVRFLGQVPRDQMPTIFAEHDVMLFTSIWAEPLARVVQEAMACGLVVIGTTTGGTPEILQDGKNGLTFEAENAVMLSEKIIELVANRNLVTSFVQAARQTVAERFTLDRMIDEVEHHLIEQRSIQIEHPV